MKFLRFRSVRTKVMFLFSLTFLLLMILLLSVTRGYFKTYFISNNEKVMTDHSKAFVTALKEKEQTIDENIRRLERETGAIVTLYNIEDVPMHFRANAQENALPPAIYAEVKRAAQESSTGTSFDILENRIIYAVILPNDELMILTKPMGLADEAAGIFLKFVNLVAICVYLIGTLLIYFITRYLTKPIDKMNAVTGKMARLDFSEKLAVEGTDEIQMLMRSVNLMASELSSTIESLSKVNQNLNTSNDRLAQELSKERNLEKMRRQFVSDVSHELKNPLAVIMSYSEGLLQGIPKNESLRKEYYDIIRDEADRMNRLVKDLLDLSGYESGTFTIEKSPFVVNDLIDETVERFTYTMADKAITIVFKERENPFTLLADRLRVGQILSNLLSNAFKHVNEGGTIRISLESVSEKTKMTISNTGALIPEAALEDIWHSFYQVDTESEGNGLGLAIVKSIVQLHQGSCRAYTTEAENCFEIML